MGEIFGDVSEPVQLTTAGEAEGTFAETKDGLAYIGSVPDFPRYLFALGFGGNGITFGAIAAEIIRDQLLQRPNAAGRLFRFGR